MLVATRTRAPHRDGHEIQQRPAPRPRKTNSAMPAIAELHRQRHREDDEQPGEDHEVHGRVVTRSRSRYHRRAALSPCTSSCPTHRLQLSARGPDCRLDPPPISPSAWHALGNDWAQWFSACCGNPRFPLVSLAPPQALDDNVAGAGRSFRSSSTRDYQAKLAALWHAAAAATAPGSRFREVVRSRRSDRRFRAPAWRASPFHSLVLQALPAPRRLPERARRERRAARRATASACSS